MTWRARAGVRDVALPGLDTARANAASHGCVTVPVQGAWTLRCEFEFLAGQPLTRFGLDALHPYLRTGHMPRTLAHHLADEGFCTVFAHPFDLRFFNRHAAMPRLGFSELIGEQHFPGVAPEGYYIPDLALAGHLLELAARESGPLFCMAVTMENHNPWDRHRLPGIEDPAEQYLHHLRNADRMIARLVEGIEAANRPAILAFYGDHVPYLPELADPFADTRTDYVVMARRDGRWLTGARRDLHLHELADEVLDTLGRL
jgi:phosphoglycerol transferase MdoB-like AlkP superfamily enzyme